MKDKFSDLKAESESLTRKLDFKQEIEVESTREEIHKQKLQVFRDINRNARITLFVLISTAGVYFLSDHYLPFDLTQIIIIFWVIAVLSWFKKI